MLSRGVTTTEDTWLRIVDALNSRHSTLGDGPGTKLRGEEKRLDKEFNFLGLPTYNLMAKGEKGRGGAKRMEPGTE